MNENYVQFVHKAILFGFFICLMGRRNCALDVCRQNFQFDCYIKHTCKVYKVYKVYKGYKVYKV